MSPDNIRSVTTASETTVITGNGRIVGIWFRLGESSGTTIIEDGEQISEEIPVLMSVTTAAAAPGGLYMKMPGAGISYSLRVDVDTLGGADSVTIYYVSDNNAA